MPRVGGIYTQPYDDVDPDTTVESAVYNGFTRDVELDLNTPRPVISGGTGANNAADALANLGAVAKAGDTMSGPLTLTFLNPYLQLSTNAEQNRILRGATLGVPRWDFYMGNATPESGANAGSDFWLIHHADNGAQLGFALTGVRSTGLLSVKADPTAALGIATKQYVDQAGASARLNGGLTPYEKLKIVYTGVSTVVLTANALVLFTAAGAGKRFENFNTTLNITTAGAGGRDAGSEAASTWYHIWAIGKADGTKSAVLSTSLSAPTLPTDYTYYGYVGAVYNDASSNFGKFTQHGSRVFSDWNGTGNLVLNNGTGTSFSSINCATTLPPNATMASIVAGLGMNPPSSPSAYVNAFFTSAGSGTTPTADDTFISRYIFSNEGGKTFVTGIEVPIVSPQTILYRITGTNGVVSVYVNGWAY